MFLYYLTTFFKNKNTKFFNLTIQYLKELLNFIEHYFQHAQLLKDLFLTFRDPDKNFKKMSSIKFRQTSVDVLFDTALVFASQYLEESIVTPILIPRVGHQPVRHIVLCAPSNKI